MRFKHYRQGIGKWLAAAYDKPVKSLFLASIFSIYMAVTYPSIYWNAFAAVSTIGMGLAKRYSNMKKKWFWQELEKLPNLVDERCTGN